MNYQPMNRFSIQSTAEANYLNVGPIDSELADAVAFQMLQEDLPDFFMPLQLRNINGQQSFRYKLPNAISLRNSLTPSMQKKAYVSTALGLISPFIRCKDWLLDYHYICIDPNYVLKNKKNDSFIFAYIPEASFRNDDESIMNFFESILNRIDISDDREYQINIMHYFRDNAGSIALFDLYKMFSEERAKVGTSYAAVSAGVHETPFAQQVQNPAPAQSFQPAQTPFQPSQQTQTPFQQPVQPSQPAMQQPGAAPQRSSGIPQPQPQVSRSVPKAGGIPQPQPQTPAQPPMQGGQNSVGAASVLFGGAEVEPFEKEEKRSHGLFGRRKNKAEDDDMFSAPASNAAPAAASGSSVDDLLFGDDGSDKKAAKGAKKGGFGGLFGSKKNARDEDETQFQQQPPVQQQPVRQAPVQQQQQQYVENPAVPYRAPVIADEFTEIVGLSNAQPYLELIDSQFDGVPRRIDLDSSKPYLTVGRRTADSSPDIAFPESCKGVSRQHARIEQTGSGMVIIDLGSVYHTVLDGQRLVPNAQYPLHNGATLVFVEDRPIRYRVHC